MTVVNLVNIIGHFGIILNHHFLTKMTVVLAKTVSSMLQHTPFWSGRHIKGEFSSQYPYSGYSIHVFAGDEEVSNLPVESGR